MVDASDANTAKLVSGDASQITDRIQSADFRRRPGGPVQAAMRLWFNPGLSSKKFYGPGVFVLGISMFPPLLAALAMAKEGEQKTILQVYVSSISAHEFLLGKIFAFMAVALGEALVMSTLLFTYFGLALAGDPTPLLIATILYTFCVASFGTMVGVNIPNQVAAHASRSARRIPPGIPALRTHVPHPEHPHRPALDLQLRLGPLLHRDRPRCLAARRRLARGLVQGHLHRHYRRCLLYARLARHEKDAGEGMNFQTILDRLLSHRLRALIKKEFNQIGRDRRLQISLVLPPVLQLTLFGFALSASVSDVRLAVVDDSRSPESRELISTLTESKSFQLAGYYTSVDQLGDAVSRGNADAGVVVPYDYARDLARDRPTTVQFLLNATNANTATISRAYAEGVIQTYNAGLAQQGIHVHAQPNPQSDPARIGQVQLQPAFIFNPGLVDSWFIVTGVLGLLLILNSSIVASAAMVREREAGTIEQLLMSPATTTEIIVAKITPLFLLLSLMMIAAIIVIKVVFSVPFHGSLPLLLIAGCLCILSGISIGTVIATFSKSAQQAQLTSFFVNPPLSSLSGALNPVEAMPKWLQPLTVINPVHHFAAIVRGTMLKGGGFMDVWPNFLGLLLFTIVLVSLSIWRFRKQLS